MPYHAEPTRASCLSRAQQRVLDALPADGPRIPFRDLQAATGLSGNVVREVVAELAEAGLADWSGAWAWRVSA